MCPEDSSLMLIAGDRFVVNHMPTFTHKAPACLNPLPEMDEFKPSFSPVSHVANKA